MRLCIVNAENAACKTVTFVPVYDCRSRRGLLDLCGCCFRLILECHDGRLALGVGFCDRYGFDPVCSCGKDKSLGGFDLRHVICAGGYLVSAGSAFCIGGEGNNASGHAVAFDACLCMGFGVIDAEGASCKTVITVIVGDRRFCGFLLYICMSGFRFILERHDSRAALGISLFDRYSLDPVCGCGKDKSLGGFDLCHVICPGH